MIKFRNLQCIPTKRKKTNLQRCKINRRVEIIGYYFEQSLSKLLIVVCVLLPCHLGRYGFRIEKLKKTKKQKIRKDDIRLQKERAELGEKGRQQDRITQKLESTLEIKKVSVQPDSCFTFTQKTLGSSSAYLRSCGHAY